jgi:hypothetical protein
VYADAPPEHTWQSGTRLIVLGGEPADVGDGLTAVTPNFVLRVDGNTVRQPDGEPGTLPLAEFRSRAARLR